MKKSNFITLLAGIIIYPMGLWYWKIPNNTMYERNLHGVSSLTSIIGYLTALILVVFCFVRLKENKSSVLFWVGFALNFVYVFAPILFFIFVITSGVTV